MDFFQAQDRSRRRTLWLVLLFLLAVGAIVAGIYLTILLTLSLSSTEQTAPSLRWWRPDLFATVTAGTLLLIGTGSLYRITLLSRGGGSAVAQALGGRAVSRSTADRLERRLINVVDEMAIAAGITTPPVYVLEEEEGINAFAAGNDPNEAVVAVTRGCLTRLSRDELQGVIAHEFSHIFNGDMRLNIRLMGVLHGILLIALIGRAMLRGSAANRSKKSGGALVGLGLLAVGYTGVVFGRLIKAAVSREREYLADASAVQFTRNPAGVIGALKKIGGLSDTRLETPKAEEASHMLFGQGVKYMVGLFSTHPPIEQRIARLDPAFAASDALVQGVRPLGGHRAALGSAGGGALALTPEQVRESVGGVEGPQLDYAQRLLADLPKAINDDLHDARRVRSLIYALLVVPQPEPAKVLAATLGAGQAQIAARALEHAQWLRRAGREFWLPLVQLALPTLRELPPAQIDRLLQELDTLSKADGRLSLFEFSLLSLLRHGLGEEPTPRRGRLEMAALRTDLTLLLSLLAHAGHDQDSGAARVAFAEATARAPLAGPWELIERDALSLPPLEQALARLRTTNFRFRGKVVEACVAAISADGRVTIQQAELLRAVGAQIECPVPPLLPGPLL